MYVSNMGIWKNNQKSSRHSRITYMQLLQYTDNLAAVHSPDMVYFILHSSDSVFDEILHFLPQLQKFCRAFQGRIRKIQKSDTFRERQGFNK